MDFDDEDHDVIDITLLLFTQGGEFALENEVLHHVEEEGFIWGGSRPGKAPNLERHGRVYFMARLSAPVFSVVSRRM